ncbi:MAG: hypothetical protein COB61_003865 [Thiotrichales bacterium]|nr:hypothetical protein [Thiotrichales bacterium]
MNDALTIVLHRIHQPHIKEQRSIANQRSKSDCATYLAATRGHNKATMALANKLIHIAWVIVARGALYRPMLIA